MEFLHLLRDISSPLLDKLFLAITFLGDEVFFIIIGLAVFWCIDKYDGYFVLSVGFIGTVINQFMKIVCRVPRPWIKDPSLSVAEGAKGGAGGYSFPSGHTQSSIGSFGSIALFARRTVRIVCIVLCALVPFSRMYLGVHTPQDVLVAAATALVLIFALRPVIKRGRENAAYMWGLIGFMVALSIGYLLFMELYHFPTTIDAGNLSHATENAYTLAGCVLGMAIVFFIDSRYLHFETAAPLFAQILKLSLGALIVFSIKEGLKVPLGAVIPHEGLARLIRYMIMVVAAGAVWPATFKWFKRLDMPNK